MHKKEEFPNIFILYDSINNSVFKSQVLNPLINSGLHWHIISFESHNVTPPTDHNITYTLLRRNRYWCTWSLRSAIKQVRSLLMHYVSYQLTARGPFAGYIALHAATQSCTSITIQARGLVAQEYAYTHKHRWWPWHHVRIYLLHHLESIVYNTRDRRVLIEAVSPALKKYLIETFHAHAHMITLAQEDIPPIIGKELRASHRLKIRTQLGISDQTIVYCYNGSYKPWQCPQETISFFQKKLAVHSNSFLLILTPDIAPFKQYIAQMQLPTHTYHICHVDQHELYHYLAAADVGLLLRQPHIINYVSRPTKALDYHAAGLRVMHNGTVDYINHIPDIKQQTLRYDYFVITQGERKK